MALGLISDDMETYKIENLSINEYSVIYDNYETYDVKREAQVADEFGEYTLENYSFSFYKTDTILKLKNNLTGKEINFEFNDLYDYGLFELKGYYLLTYVDLDKDGNVVLNYHYLYDSDLSNDEDYLQKVKDNGNKHLISAGGDLCIVHNKENDNEYVAVKTDDYGYFVLEGQGKVSILNRD